MNYYDDKTNRVITNLTSDGYFPAVSSDLGHVSKNHVVDYDCRFSIVGVVEEYDTGKYLYMLNSDNNKIAPAICQSYYKSSAVNFIGTGNGFNVPAVLEIEK